MSKNDEILRAPLERRAREELLVPSILAGLLLILYLIGAIPHQIEYRHLSPENHRRAKYLNDAAAIALSPLQLLQFPAITLRKIGSPAPEKRNDVQIRLWELSGNFFALMVYASIFIIAYRRRWRSLKFGAMWVFVLLLVYSGASLALSSTVQARRISAKNQRTLWALGEAQKNYFELHGKYAGSAEELKDIPPSYLHGDYRVKRDKAIFLNGKLLFPSEIPPLAESPPYDIPKEIIEYYGPGSDDFYWVASVGNLDTDPVLEIIVATSEPPWGSPNVTTDRRWWMDVLSNDEYHEWEVSGKIYKEEKGPTPTMKAIQQLIGWVHSDYPYGIYKMAMFSNDVERSVAYAYLSRQGGEAAHKIWIDTVNERVTYLIDISLERLAKEEDPRTLPILKEWLTESRGRWLTHNVARDGLEVNPLDGNTASRPAMALHGWNEDIYRREHFQKSFSPGRDLPITFKLSLIRAILALEVGEHSYLEPYFVEGLQRILAEKLMLLQGNSQNNSLRVLINLQSAEDAFKIMAASPIKAWEAESVFKLLDEIDEEWANKVKERFHPFFQIDVPAR